MSKLILLRHGESEWNARNLWAGRTDVGLTERGRQEARTFAKKLQDFGIDEVHVSPLRRAQETWEEILRIWGGDFPNVKISDSLVERDYGSYTGLNKTEVEQEIGPEKFKRLRRAWNEAVPQGETLQVVSGRVWPYYQQEILPALVAGRDVLVVAHGNSLRALAKNLEAVPDDQVINLEMATGEAWVYDLDDTGRVVSKEIMRQE